MNCQKGGCSCKQTQPNSTNFFSALVHWPLFAGLIYPSKLTFSPWILIQIWRKIILDCKNYWFLLVHEHLTPQNWDLKLRLNSTKKEGVPAIYEPGRWLHPHSPFSSLVLFSLWLLLVNLRDMRTKTSVAPGRPSMLCLRFCFVLCRPWFPIFNPCYVINFKLEFLRPDRTKCLETWYHYCILPNLKNSLLQFLEKMSLLEDACLGLDFPFLALAMI